MHVSVLIWFFTCSRVVLLVGGDHPRYGRDTRSNTLDTLKYSRYVENSLCAHTHSTDYDDPVVCSATGRAVPRKGICFAGGRALNANRVEGEGSRNLGR